MIATIISIVVGFFAYKYLGALALVGPFLAGLIVGIIAKRIFRAFFAAFVAFAANVLTAFSRGITGAFVAVHVASVPLSLSLLMIGAVCGVLIRRLT